MVHGTSGKLLTCQGNAAGFLKMASSVASRNVPTVYVVFRAAVYCTCIYRTRYEGSEVTTVPVCGLEVAISACNSTNSRQDDRNGVVILQDLDLTNNLLTLSYYCY